MTKEKSTDEKQLDNMSTGGHLGGTTFGQTGGDAKLKDAKPGSDKARPSDGKK